jgi:hypothetical protein
MALIQENPTPPAEAEAVEGRLGERFWGTTLSWLVSCFLHAIAFITLAILTLPLPFEPRGALTMIASVASEDDYIFEISDEAGAPGELAELAASSPAAERLELVSTEELMVEPDLGVMVQLASAASSPWETLEAASRSGGGGARQGAGVGMTSVFGVRTSGKRFVYVVDNSNSMSQGRLEAAIAEVQNSVGMLQADQSFFVIFYSDTAYPLFYPAAARTFVRATAANQEKLREWLKTVEHCLHTRGEKAMEMAMALKPDVIYLLGDGAFTDGTVAQMLERDDPRVIIHTFGFDMKRARDREGFEQMARRFRGDFHDATVEPEFVALERKLRRPRNQTTHGPWGIALPMSKGGD